VSIDRPLIGVSTGFTDYGDYLGSAFTEPLERLGATAVLLPYPSGPDALDRLVERLDGLVLAVGRDLAPALYGGERHASMTRHSTARDAAETSFARAALRLGLPTLGICRGMQVLNVTLGGTLHPDHRVLQGSAMLHPGGDWDRWHRVVRAALDGVDPPLHPTHAITIAPGSLLARALGVRATVNSYHHQSIDKLGSGVVVTASASDGVIEAIEVPGAAALTIGVQWELQEHARRGGEGTRVLELLVDAACGRQTRRAPTRFPGRGRT
jgi:putative glutamine amidotransferase